jgi:hypothetical protein
VNFLRTCWITFLSARDHFQRLGDVLGQLAQPLAAATEASGWSRHDHPLARHMRGEGLARGALAGEGRHRGLGHRHLGGDLVFGGRTLQLLQRQLGLIQNPRRATHPAQTTPRRSPASAPPATRGCAPPLSRSYAHNRLCGHFSLSHRQKSHQAPRNEAIQEGGPGRRDTPILPLGAFHIIGGLGVAIISAGQLCRGPGGLLIIAPSM